MSDFNRAYAFVSAWLWDCREHGSVRRTTDRAWDNHRCADVADMLKDYTKELQAKIKELEDVFDRQQLLIAESMDYTTDLQAKVDELTAKLKQRDFQDEVLEETGRLLDKSQAKVEELTALCQARSQQLINANERIATLSQESE